jgi:hypothetical protein
MKPVLWYAAILIAVTVFLVSPSSRTLSLSIMLAAGIIIGACAPDDK